MKRVPLLFGFGAFIAVSMLAGCSTHGSAFNPPEASIASHLKHMYVSTYDGDVLVYDVPVTSSSTPAQTITGLADPAGLFVDAKGRLFVPISGNTGTGNTIQVYDSPVTSSSTPAFTLTTLGGGVQATAEDTAGDIYESVDSGATCCIDVFPGPVDGNATASYELSANGVTNGLDYPWGLAVGTNDDLYVSNTGSILAYASPISSSSTPSAIVTPNDDAYGLAIDSRDRIFVADASGNGVVNVFRQPFTSASTPAFNLDFTPGCPAFDVAFDGSGNLWATDCNGVIWEVPAPITASSKPTAVLTVPDAYGVAFGP